MLLLESGYKLIKLRKQMLELTRGAVIGVPCDVRPGPFSGEQLITLDTENGPISGFVRDNELKTVSDKWYVRAIIESIEDDLLSVKIRGSFFTTNGIATIPRSSALAA